MSRSSQPAISSEPLYAQPKKNFTEYPWYNQNIDKYLTPEMQELLEKYANIAPTEQHKHVHDIRDKAFAIRSYPCTGLGVFLTPYTPHSPCYRTIIERLQTGATLLDIGCFLGVDLRRLVFDGAPSDRMYGVDIVSHWDLGFDLFRDRDGFHAKFIEADILSDRPETGGAGSESGHYLDLGRAASVGVGGTGYGCEEIGNVNGGAPLWKATQTRNFMHDLITFTALWEQVARETGTRWNTDARLMTFEDMRWDPLDQRSLPKGSRVLDFVVTRVD